MSGTVQGTHAWVSGRGRGPRGGRLCLAQLFTLEQIPS